MPSSGYRVLVLGIVAVLAATGSARLLSSREPETLPAPSPFAAPESGRYLGAASCASTACHRQSQQPLTPGSSPTRGEGSSKGCEFTIWMNRDKHARAYQVLFDERSRWIERNLKQLADAKDAHPEQNVLCLKCHAIQAAEGQRGATFAIEDGVSCERCHGPAERWLTQHYLPEWKRKGAQQKIELGMWPTKDLVVRAQLCAECHVGSADAEVNHDLLAAGHPRINNFELANHLAMLPPHWSQRDEKARYPDFEARVWFVGQVVSARASLELLEKRAGDIEKPWPEFAEHDCYACHHELREPSRRQLRDAKVSFAWNPWYMATLRFALEEEPAAISELRQLLGKSNPDRRRVAEQARSAADELKRRLEQIISNKYDDPAALQKLLNRLTSEDPERAQSSWDEAAQRYLALVAVYRAASEREKRDPGIEKSLRALHGMLDLPRGFISPPRFDRVKFGDELRSIGERLGK
jgi:hypothetical protein